jgi:uncharacterized Fe-S cluster-containing radical SAM superfamily protein
MPRLIDSESLARVMKQRVVRSAERRLLISNISGSAEAEDSYAIVNCRGFGRKRAFRTYRFQGPLDDSIERTRTQRVLCSGYPRENVTYTQVFQLGGCSWRCWYCYVDVALLSGTESRGAWLTSEDLLELYEEEPDRPDIIDLSGGQPDLAPGWPVWMVRALAAKSYGNRIFLRSEDNLSGALLTETLDASDLRILREARYSRIGCFKGFDAESFSFNTKAVPSGFDRQFEVARDIISAGIDFFAYVTLTGPRTEDIAAKVADFMDRLQDVHPLLPLRVVPLKVTPSSTWPQPGSPVAADAGRTEIEALSRWTAEIVRRIPAATRSLPMEEISL